MLADRYAWTAVAREIARGLEPDWAAALYRFTPCPDLILFHRQEAAAALTRALATRPTSVGAESVSGAYGAFLERLMAAYDGLLADPSSGPWLAPAIVLDPRAGAAVRAEAVRSAVTPLLRVGVTAG